MFAQTVINILGSRLTWPKSRQECPTSRPRAATSAPRVAQEPPETRPDPAKSLVARPGVAQEQPTEPQDLAPGRPESPRSRPTAAKDGPTGLGPSLQGRKATADQADKLDKIADQFCSTTRSTQLYGFSTATDSTLRYRYSDKKIINIKIYR